MPPRRTFLCLTTAALAGCSAPPARATAGRLVGLQIVDRQRGQALAEHRRRGVSWVAGRPGERYAVRLSNHSAARVLVVLSVDGINAISGQTANASQTGYVLAPWQSAEITGWRKNDDEAAAFYFTALPDSYAARTERPNNVGVIGAAVFRERVPEPSPPVAFERSSKASAESPRDSAASHGGAGNAATPAPSAAPAESWRERDASNELRASKLGTGHGEREHSPIGRTGFERATSQPAEIVQVRYDSHANLVAAGIIGAPPRWGTPEPFPGFVPDPP